MTDTPPTPDATPKPGGHGVKGFMKTNTAGMPNWVWLLVIGGGIAAAVVIPKLLNRGNSSTPTDTSAGGICPGGYVFAPSLANVGDFPGAIPVTGGYCIPVAPTNPPPPTTPPPPDGTPPTGWPDTLKDQKIWEGTSSHQFFYGPSGPQKGKKGQTLLSTLFPSGTTFRSDTGKAGGKLYYTLSGGKEQLAPVTLVDPNPPKGTSGSNVMEIIPEWPGGTTQVRGIG
jgi:hypothetical protein